MVFSNSAGLYEYDHDASKARELEVAIRIKVIIHMELSTEKFSKVVTMETNIQNIVDKSLQANLAVSIVDVKFTSQDSYDNAYFSLKALPAELPESVIEALHDESDIGLVVDYSLKTRSKA